MLTSSELQALELAKANIQFITNLTAPALFAAVCILAIASIIATKNKGYTGFSIAIAAALFHLVILLGFLRANPEHHLPEPQIVQKFLTEYCPPNTPPLHKLTTPKLNTLLQTCTPPSSNQP